MAPDVINILGGVNIGPHELPIQPNNHLNIPCITFTVLYTIGLDIVLKFSRVGVFSPCNELP